MTVISQGLPCIAEGHGSSDAGEGHSILSYVVVHILRIYLSAIVTCRGSIVLLHRNWGGTLEDLRGAEAVVPILVAVVVGSQ